MAQIVRLLSSRQVSELLDTTPKVAERILIAHGLHPVNLGRGRGRGKRWLENAVHELILALHADAQLLSGAEPERCIKSSNRPPSSLLTMPLDQLYELTRPGRVH